MKFIVHILLLTIYIIVANSTLHSRLLEDVQVLMEKEPNILTANLLHRPKEETLNLNLDKRQSDELQTKDDDNNLFENDFGLWHTGDMNSNKPLTLDNVKTIIDTYLKEDPSLEKLYAEKPKLSKLNIPKTNWNKRKNENKNKVYLTVQKDHNTYHNNKMLTHIKRRNKPESESSLSTGDESSTGEVKRWREEFVNDWLKRKWEALNSSRPVGDDVNMLAARPWGSVCGDPDQHDMPWGSCMLSPQCEPEYRIFRGDYFCGRTSYVCCGILLTTYDLYQGVDVTFEHKSLSTDTEEARKAAGENIDHPERHIARGKRNRAMERLKRRQKLKKSLSRIMYEMKKILHKIETNGTKERKKRTKTIKRFIHHLKKQYKNDRIAIRDYHLETVNRVDKALVHQLEKIVSMNQEFLNNATFREIVINGTIDKRGARMLAEAYPALIPYLPFRRPLDKLPKRKRAILEKLIRDNEMKNRAMEERALRQRFRAIEEEPQNEPVQIEPKQQRSFYLQDLRRLNEAKNSEARRLMDAYYGQKFDKYLQNLFRKYD